MRSRRLICILATEELMGVFLEVFKVRSNPSRCVGFSLVSVRVRPPPVLALNTLSTVADGAQTTAA